MPHKDPVVRSPAFAPKATAGRRKSVVRKKPKEKLNRSSQISKPIAVETAGLPIPVTVPHPYLWGAIFIGIPSMIVYIIGKLYGRSKVRNFIRRSKELDRLHATYPDLRKRELNDLSKKAVNDRGQVSVCLSGVAL
jgi:hypothetical protein